MVDEGERVEEGVGMVGGEGEGEVSFSQPARIRYAMSARPPLTRPPSLPHPASGRRTAVLLGSR